MRLAAVVGIVGLGAACRSQPEPTKIASIAAPVPEPVPAAKPPDAAPPADAQVPAAQTTVIAAHRPQPQQLIADASGAYWVEPGEGSATVFHATAATPPAKLATFTGEVTALALDRGWIYAAIAAADGKSRIARVAAGKREETVAKLDTRIEGLAVDASGIYWGDGGGDFFKLSPKRKPQQLASSVEYSFADRVAVDATYVYWSNELDDTPRRIYRVAKAGGDVQQVNVNPVAGWLVTAAGAIYYGADAELWKVTDVTADGPTTVRLGAGSPLALVGDRLLVTSGDAETVLQDVSVATGAPGALHVSLGGNIVGLAAADGGVWLVRNADSSGDTPSATIELFAP